MSEVQTGRLPLADLIDAVRGELQRAAAEARNAELQFEVQDVNLEVEVAATGTKGVDGGIKLWAFTLGGKASKSDTATQTVTLKLGAVNKTGGKFHVSDLSSEHLRKE
jgi:hypothetical protein